MMRADDLTRELGKALEALRWTKRHLTAVNEGNAALHCNERVFYSPLTTQVHEAVLSLERVTADLDSDTPNEPRPDGWAEQRREFAADVIEAFDVPGWVGGPETEREVLRRQLSRAIESVQDGHAAPVEVGDERIVAAVMPIVDKVLVNRNRARAAAGRAYQLADRWRAAHGSSMFLVRAAGAELRDALDDEAEPDHDWHHPTPLSGLVCRRCDLAHKFWSGEVCIADRSVELLAAAECSAQYYKANAGPRRQCIRAAQHRGDHVDEHGFHWSDTVAVYPVIDGKPNCGRASASSCTNPDHACAICGECVHQHPGEGGCYDTSQTPPDQGPLTRIEVRDPCPYCEDCPLIPRTLMDEHVREHHPDVTLASRENGAPAAAAEPATCDAYRPPTSPQDAGLCARCGMFDYKHRAATATEAALIEAQQLISMLGELIGAERRIVMTAMGHREDLNVRTDACSRCGRDHMAELEKEILAADRAYAEAFPATAGGPARPGRLPDDAPRTPRQRAYEAVKAYIDSLGDRLPTTRSARTAQIWLAVNRALEAAGHATDPEAQCRLPHEMEA
ncbi:hypothetical protein ACYF6T_38990 [Streptomyces sp. 7R007]